MFWSCTLLAVTQKILIIHRSQLIVNQMALCSAEERDITLLGEPVPLDFNHKEHWLLTSEYKYIL